MHKVQHIKDPSSVRDLIRVALAEKQSALLLHRLDCVLLIAEGRSVQEVAHWFGVSKRSVQRWVHAAYLSGIDGLIQHCHDGRPPCLSPEQAHAIRRDLMAPPGACGYPDLRWTGKRLAWHLHRCYGLKISERSSQRIIARSRGGIAVPSRNGGLGATYIGVHVESAAIAPTAGRPSPFLL